MVPTAAANFFSFFTIQSNLIACAALLIGGVLLLRTRDLTVPEPRWFAVLLAAATTYMLTTGIVYNTLLRGIELPQGATVPWSNEVLHVIAPVYLAIDLFVAPRRRRLGWGAILIIVGYPIVWAVYTLVRGPLITAPSRATRGGIPIRSSIRTRCRAGTWASPATSSESRC
ncbi:Pr6Pr family membrane protein [Microbacterium sp. NIBRBAC000506063]|uniref:Pr6Pr family membrane protein n=1 Tax=Microbacterium sp. NIBRBAC000506063 TaxID=2734618 RepID=UPI001CB72895|nr:Pr6Pr family membrane protein [Microbacterium sp. NIBRBAC000506063]